MAKIFGYYSDDIDRCWYDSSNVKYSECVDKENELKTLRVVFSNGTQYEYTGVDVGKYLLFREDLSQGKALNKYIKSEGYEYRKLDDADIGQLNEELEFRSSGGIYLVCMPNGIKLRNCKDEVIYSSDVEPDEDLVHMIKEIIESLGHKVQEKTEDWNGNNIE